MALLVALLEEAVEVALLEGAVEEVALEGSEGRTLLLNTPLE